jgi:hypothetical protein
VNNRIEIKWNFGKLLFITGMFFFVTIFTFRFQAQSDFKLAVSGQLSVGTHLVKLENFQEERWNMNIPATVHLVPKLQLRWKNMISLNAGGGLAMYNYSFSQRDASYTISLIAFKLEASMLGYIPLEGRKVDALNFGCAVGMIGLSGSEKTTRGKSFIARASTPVASPLYFSPQIGTYRRDDRFGYSLSLQFTKYLMDGPIVSFEMDATNSVARASHSGNYIGLNIVVDYDLSADKAPKKPEPEITPEHYVDPPTDVYSRKDKAAGSFEFKRKHIKLLVWDHSMIDHDTISLLFNGRVVLSEHHLDLKKKKVKVELKSGTNELLMYAHNEGSISPNSAALIIRHGLFRKETIFLNASYDDNAVLKLKLVE